MDTNRENVLTRLDDALSQWNTDLDEADRALSDHLTKLQDRLHALATESDARAGETAALSEANAKIEALAHIVAERDREAGNALKKIAELRQDSARMSAELERLRAESLDRATQDVIRQNEIESLRSETARLGEELTMTTEKLDAAKAELERRVPAELLEEIERRFESEHTRANFLEEQLRARQNEQAESALRERLAAALRDRDEAHQEIVSLRADIEMLRRANAALSTPTAPKPAPVSELESLDPEKRRQRMGEVLIDLGILTSEQLDAALSEQETAPHRRLGAILVEKGYTSEQVVSQVVARQLDLPFVRLTGGVVEDGAPRTISAGLARRRMCVPVTVLPDRVVLAMSNPFDLLAVDDVELATGRRVDPVVATTSDVAAALARYYD